MTTSVYICADSTLTYGPYGGRHKIIKEALPIAITESEDEAMLLITTIGRMAWDAHEADANFEEALKGRAIAPGYGPRHRYYYSGPEFERNNVSTLITVRRATEQVLARLRRK